MYRQSFRCRQFFVVVVFSLPLLFLFLFWQNEWWNARRVHVKYVYKIICYCWIVHWQLNEWVVRIEFLLHFVNGDVVGLVIVIVVAIHFWRSLSVCMGVRITNFLFSIICTLCGSFWLMRHISIVLFAICVLPTFRAIT